MLEGRIAGEKNYEEEIFHSKTHRELDSRAAELGARRKLWLQCILKTQEVTNHNWHLLKRPFLNYIYMGTSQNHFPSTALSGCQFF